MRSRSAPTSRGPRQVRYGHTGALFFWGAGNFYGRRNRGGNLCCRRELSGYGKRAKGATLMFSEFAALEVANVVTACAIIGGLYLLCRNTPRSEEKKASRQILTSDYK